MENVEYIKEGRAVVVPIAEWERLQRDLVRLRKRLKKAEVLRDIATTVRQIEIDAADGKAPSGTDAHEFVKDLMYDD